MEYLKLKRCFKVWAIHCNGSCEEITGYIWLQFDQTERAWDQKAGDLNFNSCAILKYLWD